MASGSIIRFDELRGYGFIAPADGGEDIFFHANDFGEQRRLVRPGLTVDFEVTEGDRGLKVASVALQGVPAEAPHGTSSPRLANDECDVLTAAAFTAAVTELLIEHAPTLTGAQIMQARARLLTFADGHGWIEG